MNNINGGNLFKRISRNVNSSAKQARKKAKHLQKQIRKGVHNVEQTIEKTAYEVTDNIKEKVMNKIDFMSKVIFNNPGLAPYVLEIMKNHGNKEIVQLTLCRALVPIAIRKLMYKLSNDGKEKVLYHLYIIAQLDDNTQLLIEKNERINISKTIITPVQSLDVPIDDDLTINDLINGARSNLGEKKFLNYNASSSNCQHFIQACIVSNDLMNTERQNFIKQDTTDVFQDSDTLRKFSNLIVNEVAARFSTLTNGGSIKKTSNKNPWLEHVRKFREQNPGMSYADALKQASQTYKKESPKTGGKIASSRPKVIHNAQNDKQLIRRTAKSVVKRRGSSTCSSICWTII